MVAHLDCGLGQSLGQMINIYNAKLPVVTLTYAADTGSAIGQARLGPSHRPQLRPHLPHRAVRQGELVGNRNRTASPTPPIGRCSPRMTPPVGPVHLAIYEDALSLEPVRRDHRHRPVAGAARRVSRRWRRGADPAARWARRQRPLLFVGDGVWKSGAVELLNRFAERVGARINEGDQFPRYVQTNHPLGCQDLAALDPDLVVALGHPPVHSFARSQATYRALSPCPGDRGGRRRRESDQLRGALRTPSWRTRQRTLERLLAALEQSLR